MPLSALGHARSVIPADAGRFESTLGLVVSPYIDVVLHVVPPPSSSLAERYLSVHLVTVVLPRRTVVRNQLVALAEWSLPDVLIPWFPGIPKDPANVVVVRRSDDLPLLTYEYEYLNSAIRHRDSLVERLQTEHIFDLCRDLGLDMERVGSPISD